MQRMNETIRKKIDSYRKNKLDISELIKNYSLKDECLSGCVISNMNVIGQDISNCNFSCCIIGEKDNTVYFSKAIMKGCNFKNAIFPGKVHMRYVDARNCNFSDCFLAYVQYQFGDFRNCNFCNTVIPVGSRVGHHSKFGANLIKQWGVDLT